MRCHLRYASAGLALLPFAIMTSGVDEQNFSPSGARGERTSRAGESGGRSKGSERDSEGDPPTILGQQIPLAGRRRRLSDR